MTDAALRTLPQAPTELPRRDLGRTAFNTVMWAVFIGLLVWGWAPAGMNNVVSLFTGAGNMAEYAHGFLAPDFHNWPTYLQEMIVTVQIAIWGTVLAVVVGVPFGILSSENMAPIWIVQPVRRLMDALRAINELVFAMLFVVAVGLGPFAGVMALFVHTTGIIAKLFSEAVEAIDPRPVEAIRATGAGRIQEVVFGVIPQVIPLWISYSLYRFESNVRSATVLGIVGAGGIGQLLWEYVRGFYYSETAAVMIIIVISVTVIDIISQRLRKLVI
ncbi:phosphonate ABC transporter, permease protein PhnE [Rhodospirillaceae bacterium SYSU D60014]|uniref:phosphonate ABC transporter, permease protein PhnE n=1 Tax=Virgifigura deserti TaxID=2268457 RepID=UPI000E674D0D